MKKFKKLLAGLLAGAMMLGSMTATAFAEGASSTTVSTVDTTKKGSITVHKYYFTNNDTSTGNGTGEEESDIPEGALPLEGAEFSIWKIADIDGNVTIEGKTNEKFVVQGNLGVDVRRAEELIGDKTADAIKTTDDLGIVVFGKGSTLELGYYYVKETKTPANISSTPSAFVVSVPMTSKKTNKGSEWIYNVHVYPKNVKTEAGVTIKKVGADGTDIAANAKFILQKKNSEGLWKYVAENSGSYNYEVETCGDATEFAQDTSITGLGQGSYRLFEVSAGFGYIMDGTIPYEFDIAGNGEISKANPGDKYLTFAQENGENNLKSAIITVKNERPDLEKTVKEVDEWKSEADKALSDTIEYRVKVTVPSNIAKLNTFSIKDTPVNIIDDIDTIKLYENEDLSTEIIGLTKGTDYIITKAGNGFVLDFISNSGKVTDAFASKYANGGVLYVSYQAKLTDAAVSTTNGNLNAARLDYSNGIYPSATESDKPNPGKEQDKAYIEDKAVVYTFKFTINKTNESGEALKGAHFALYKCDASGYTTESDVKGHGAIVKKWEFDGVNAISTFEADKLEAGYYYLIETKAPDGYNLLTAPVEIKELNVQYVTTWSTNFQFAKDGEGPWHLVKREIESATFKYNDNGAVKDITGEMTVVNKKGFELPSTGGMGTVIFSVLGIALVLAGLLVITASRKKAAK